MKARGLSPTSAENLSVTTSQARDSTIDPPPGSTQWPLFKKARHFTPKSTNILKAATSQIEANMLEQPPIHTQQQTFKNAHDLPSKFGKKLRVAFSQGEDLQTVHQTFHPFPKFPPELRLKVWKYAIIAIPPRVICLQPEVEEVVPGVLQTCTESREEAKKTFSIVESSQPTLSFAIYVNFAKDTVYLKGRFIDPAKECYPSVVHGAVHFYKGVMREVRVLAMNLMDMYHLTSAYRGGNRDLWEILHENCPKLDMIMLVIDGQAKGVKGRIKTQFRRLYINTNCPTAELVQRHLKLVAVMSSAVEASRRKGLCKEVVKCIGSIDQTKKLPMKDGEKGNKDGTGVYDSYGFSDVSMRRTPKTERTAAADSGV